MPRMRKWASLIWRWPVGDCRFARFDQIAAPASDEVRDEQWVRERADGGGIRWLRLVITKHKDSTGSATLLYGLLPPKAR